MGLRTSRVGATRLREVLVSGRAARTALFSGKALENKLGFRFSIVVPKKGLPSAADRNRLKRRCREAFRAANSATPIDLVVTARASALVAPWRDLVDEARELVGCYSRKT
jgi:ribonuclease P protein component